MNKEREIAGVKVFVSGETYNEYKGTLEEQLQERIDKAIEYINYWGIDEEHNDDKLLRRILKKLLNILEGSDKE